MMKNALTNTIVQSSKKKESHLRYFIKTRLRSFVYAGRGVGYLVRNEHSSWIHLFFSLLVIAGGLFFELSVYDWRWIALSLALVWSAEAFNTSLEAICDLVSPDFHPLVKIAKDLAAGAVLILSFFAAFVGLSIFAPLVWSVYL